MSRIDLVIPTYNGRDYLRECLEAVRQQTYPDVHVIVVDDGSTDGTDMMMTNQFPEFTYRSLSGNQGFARACNAGIDAGTAPLVALLNNDAIPEPEWLERLAAGLKRHPAAAAATGKILLADCSGRLHATGDTFSWNGLANSRGVWEHDIGQYDREEEVFSACAAAAIYHRTALDRARSTSGTVFESDFFMYCEDIDLSWRLRLLGYTVVYIPDAEVKHHLSATGGGTLASYYVARNSFAVLARNLPTGLQRRIWPRFISHQARQFITTVTHIREPAARARLRGLLAGPSFALRQRRKRTAIQGRRQADNDDITRLLER